MPALSGFIWFPASLSNQIQTDNAGLLGIRKLLGWFTKCRLCQFQLGQIMWTAMHVNFPQSGSMERTVAFIDSAVVNISVPPFC
ncbi:hypothetical protein K438DRAFT_939786 [Mycena galopus ATCC 62051]|nr:hypothetical protein K438DRAFT_939786 [Mycena galopus ATCC 62051]